MSNNNSRDTVRIAHASVIEHQNKIRERLKVEAEQEDSNLWDEDTSVVERPLTMRELVDEK